MFGIAYAALFTAFDTASWAAGAGIGVAHGIVFIGMGAMHPRMVPADTLSGQSSVAYEDGEVRIAAPGPFGKNYGGMTPMGLLVGHAVYGVVVALVYAALV